MSGALDKRLHGIRDRQLLLSDLDPLWEVARGLEKEQQRINAMVLKHMEEEDQDRKAVLDVFRGIADSVKDVLKAIPEDHLGRPDFYGHREDHIEQRETRAVRKEDKKTFLRGLYETGAQVLVGGAVLLVLGEKGLELLKAVVH